MYWSINGSIRTMSMDKAKYIVSRLAIDMYGTAWMAEVVSLEKALMAA
jgi:hypothetical protein